jgi:hypothetical protein
MRSSARSAVVVVVLALAIARAAHASEDPSVGIATGTTSDRHGAVFVDPLGFLMFGGRIGAEAGGSRITGAVYGRWFNAGVLSHNLFLKNGESFGFSYGGGVRGRYYASDNQAGLHVGLGLEYLRTRIENASVRIATTSGYLVPQAEVGYRFARGRLFADGSVAMGYATQLSGSVSNLSGGNSAGLYTAADESSVYAAASLELGVLF